MLKIKNKYLRAKINEENGVLMTLTENDNEIINRHGNKMGLRINDEEIDLSSAECRLEFLRNNSATFSLSTEDYRLSVEYTLVKKQLIVRHTVKNLGDKAEFVLSLQNGIFIDELYKYDLLFASKQNIGGETKLLRSSRGLPLFSEYFTDNILSIPAADFSKVVLRNRTNGDRVGFAFPDSAEFLLENRNEGVLYVSARSRSVRINRGKQHTWVHKLTALPKY